MVFRLLCNKFLVKHPKEKTGRNQAVEDSGKDVERDGKVVAKKPKELTKRSLTVESNGKDAGLVSQNGKSKEVKLFNFQKKLSQLYQVNSSLHKSHL